jgi:pimeloyl-ACP methyl ester carboxylesterase
MLLPISKKLVRILPSQTAFHIVQALANRTQRPKVLANQQSAMASGRRMRYGPRGNVAWTWGEGPLVVLIHGWNGRAAQMAPLAASIAAQGFRCACIDVTGHGDSPGSRTAWRYFIDDIAELVRDLGESPLALIGHSAGGLAMMAARAIKGLRATRYVCICSPSHPFPPVRTIKQRIDPPEPVFDLYRAYLARQFDTTWSEMEAGRAFAQAGPELLLFYDEDDRFVDHREGDRIHSWCRGATLRKTTNYGHGKVLSAPELAEAVIDFLLASSPPTRRALR